MRRVRVSSQRSPVLKLGDSQVVLSPRFRFAMPPPPHLSLFHHLGGEQLDDACPPIQALIPGLPDDVSLSCLLRLPVHAHPACRSVCRRWRQLLADKGTFFTQRRVVGLSAPWLFVLACDSCSGKPHCQVLDLTHRSWHTIPSIPLPSKGRLHGSTCVAVPTFTSTDRDDSPDQYAGGAVLVLGGVNDTDNDEDGDRSLDLVFKFEMHRNLWAVMNRMPTPRSFFAAAAIDGVVYAAGGSAGSADLDSAEALDPRTGKWKPLSSMNAGMSSYDAAAMDGKLFVTEGWMWPLLFSPRGQVYDPRTDNWEAMAAGLREGWTGASAVVLGHLFVVSEEHGGEAGEALLTRVKVYDIGTDTWDTVRGPPVPKRIRKPFCVASAAATTAGSRNVGGTNGELLVIVGKDLEVAVGLVDREKRAEEIKGEKWRFSIAWQEESDASRRGGGGGICDLTPSSVQVLLG